MLSLIVPAYNEERRIGKMLEAYCRHFGRSVELIVVLNGCRDRTRDVVESIHAQFDTPMRIIDIPEPIGKGGAIIEGFRVATAPMVGFVDADGATSPVEFQKLVEALDDRVDGVIASRWHPRSTVRNRTSALRRFMSRAVAVIVRTLFRMPYTDTQCGAKVFRQQLVRTLLPHLKVRDMMFDVELLFLAQQRGYRVREQPTVWIDQSGSGFLRSPLHIIRQSLRFLLTILYIRFSTYD